MNKDNKPKKHSTYYQTIFDKVLTDIKERKNKETSTVEQRTKYNNAKRKKDGQTIQAASMQTDTQTAESETNLVSHNIRKVVKTYVKGLSQPTQNDNDIAKKTLYAMATTYSQNNEIDYQYQLMVRLVNEMIRFGGHQNHIKMNNPDFLKKIADFYHHSFKRPTADMTITNLVLTAPAALQHSNYHNSLVNLALILFQHNTIELNQYRQKDVQSTNSADRSLRKIEVSELISANVEIIQSVMLFTTRMNYQLHFHRLISFLAQATNTLGFQSQDQQQNDYRFLMHILRLKAKVYSSQVTQIVMRLLQNTNNPEPRLLNQTITFLNNLQNDTTLCQSLIGNTLQNVIQAKDAQPAFQQLLIIAKEKAPQLKSKPIQQLQSMIKANTKQDSCRNNYTQRRDNKVIVESSQIKLC